MVGMDKVGTDPKKIAKIYDTTIETVTATLKKYAETGSVRDRPRSGRPKKTSEREDRHMFNHLRNNSDTSSRYMATNIVSYFYRKEGFSLASTRPIKRMGSKSLCCSKETLT
jgi:transposase